ncbi:MAG: XrtA system polysaccharide deacetylase [Sphingomonadales bacterium]
MDANATAIDTEGEMMNALTVDVEDYFHVEAFSGHIKRAEWDNFPCRVERNTERVLGMLADHGAEATFFVLGWVAERYPALVKRIARNGHEVASHGCQHFRVVEQTPEAFRDDVRRAKGLLEDISGSPVRGYRAPSFSIGRENLWALDILAQEGYVYSSSVYPIRHDLYGMPGAPRFAFRPNGRDGFLELPISTVSIGDFKFPCGGGGYFRLFPYEWSRWAWRRINETDHKPCIFYFHPWEIDPDQPRQRQAGLKSRLRHYTNLRRMEGKLRFALRDFTWRRLDDTFLSEPARFEQANLA